ncbi:MAG: SDR family oxidoreductase [Phycisphaeraceae bacterium]|nr:SDR family oxidoreductase [Phycisphaeraceae bacterium]MCP4011518.1 SDR family oxidoreductase [Phycisphaeraceae bacterium]MCP4067844.1 SDR family oxidoreductase [Phycisphaeraceae bacterium]
MIDRSPESSAPSTRRILVVGAGGGIGRALVGRLLAAGNTVVGAARDVDALGSVEGLESRHQLDARDPDATEALVGSLHREDALHGIVNLAGCISLKPAHMVSTDEWNETIATKLTTAFSCVKAAGRHLKAGGSVVLVSTVAAGTGLSNHEAIAAAGAGVEGLARAAAATYAARGLRFNVVAPGLVDTPLASKITGSERALEHSRKMHPLGRIGVADDVAPAIAWLLSSDADWITGQTIGIDGGLGALRVPAS